MPRVATHAHTFDVRSDAEARSGVHVSASPPVLPQLGTRTLAFAHATGSPSPHDVQSASDDHAVVWETLAGAGVAGLGFLGAGFAPGSRSIPGEGPTFETWIEFTLLTESAATGIAFLDPLTAGEGFDLFELAIFDDDELILDVSFDDVDSATAFLDERLVRLPPRDEVTLERRIRVAVDLTSGDASDGFGIEVALLAQVPEPSALLLHALGLALLAATRRGCVRAQNV